MNPEGFPINVKHSRWLPIITSRPFDSRIDREIAQDRAFRVCKREAWGFSCSVWIFKSEETGK